MLKLLEDHISLDSNFVVVIGNPRVGAPRGCKDALDSILNRFRLLANPVLALCSRLVPVYIWKGLLSGLSLLPSSCK